MEKAGTTYGPNKTATAVVLVSAGTAPAACAGGAQPKLRILQLRSGLVNRSGVRGSAQSKGEPAPSAPEFKDVT